MTKAKYAKNDEYYTQYQDIEKELIHYKKYFKNKVILCNCNDSETSNFFIYFKNNFNEFKLNKLICISKEYKLEFNGDNLIKTKLITNGDFRNEECIEILKQCDIVITNPPFSLFKEYLKQLIDYNKQFIILGNPNVMTCKDIFPYFKEQKVWTGFKTIGSVLFDVPDNYIDLLKNNGREGSNHVIKDNKIKGRASAVWFTNLIHNKRKKEFKLTKLFNSKFYPKYDNYNAINVDKVTDIPLDYNEVMGVPITFLDKYKPFHNEEYKFKILGLDRFIEDNPIYNRRFTINGIEKYARVLIKRVF